MTQCNAVVQGIMSCFALGLGLPEDYFVKVRGSLATPQQPAALNTEQAMALMSARDFALSAAILAVARGRGSSDMS